jgi:cobalt-zinc-cadmium efflux system outer membrane protein
MAIKIQDKMKKTLFILALLVSSVGFGQSLEEYMQEAAVNNPSLKAKYLAYEAALQKVPQVGSLPDPELSFGFFASPVETRVGPQRARFEARQMFPWFGTLGAQKDAATEMAKAKYELFINARNEIFFGVEKAYYQLYELDEATRITKENIRILETYERLALTRFENNQGGMIDVLRVQLETGELKTQLLNLAERRKAVVSDLNAMLNRPETYVSTIETVAERQPELEIPSLLDSIKSQNPMLLGLEHQRQASLNSSVAAKRNGAPKFGVGLSYTVVDKRTDMDVPQNGQDVWMPMMSVSLPIYRKKYNGQYKEQQLLSEMYEAEHLDKGNMLNSKLQMAVADMTDADNRLSLYREQMRIAEQALQILVDAYSTGGKDFEEILRIQRMLLKYQLETAKAIKDKNTAVAAMEALY